MDASDLRVFEAVARVGNITKAAVILNTVQSNVTTRIRSLACRFFIGMHAE
jgi:LysR family transcriptional regulator, cell division regulator